VGLPFASLLPGKPSAIQELCVIYDCDAEADVNPVENKWVAPAACFNAPLDPARQAIFTL
jgi:hypothetical protein